MTSHEKLLAGVFVMFGVIGGTIWQSSKSSKPATFAEVVRSVEPAASGYRIVDEEDLSMPGRLRRQIRIQVDGPETEAELRTICEQVLASRDDLRSSNAVDFLFYLPGTDTRRLFTAGQATWAPDGRWENAGRVVAGDVSRHELVVQVGNAIGNRFTIDEAPLPESKRRRVFYELVAAQDAGVGDSEAYTLLARKYDLPEDMLYKIAGEGAAKGWPMP